MCATRVLHNSCCIRVLRFRMQYIFLAGFRKCRLSLEELLLQDMDIYVCTTPYIDAVWTCAECNVHPLVVGTASRACCKNVGIRYRRQHSLQPNRTHR